VKFFSLIYCSLVICASAVAQDSISQSHRYFGIRLGVAISHPNFAKGSPPSDFKTIWGAGLTGGFFLNVPVSENLTIQPEYIFRQMNSEITESKTSLRFSYLSLPVFLKYRIVKKLNLLAGPQFDLLIKAERKTNGETTDITRDTEERSIAAVVGLEYNFWKTMALDVRYIHGFNHIATEPEMGAGYEFKFEGLQVTVGVSF